tara:strand:+ start:13706 stop:15349 length:1644 start_codon:yes stop_codon:yes gene_type:complete
MADYPISNVARRVVYTGSAGEGPYAFEFEVLIDTDINVYKDDVLLTLTTDYTVSISPTLGTGSITLVVAAAGTNRITIVGSRAIERTTDFTTGGDFFANTLNDEMDSQTILVQQVAESAERSIKAPLTDPTTINMTLPINTSRAGKTLAFDANGDPVPGDPIGNWRGNWAAGISFQNRDIVKDTTNSNVYLTTTAHVSSGALPISTNTDVAKWSLVVDAAAAGAAQIAAEAAQAAAETAETNAETAETNAASSASTASTQAGIATTKAGEASTSASGASTSASTATTKASEASTSATNAASSASTASTQASNAGSSASAASTSESNAATSETNASTSAGTATTQASTATTQAGIATTKAGEASASASSASTSASNASSSKTDAEAALSSFNAVYLGAQASDPTNDNNGDPVTAGDWYFNNVSNRSKIYDGSAWGFVAVDTATVVSKTSATGSAIIPAGTTAQRDGTPSAGYLRWNSTDTSAEVYDGSAWVGVGGGGPSLGTDSIIRTNAQTISENITIPVGTNGMSIGDITVADTYTVTVNGRWVVI